MWSRRAKEAAWGVAVPREKRKKPDISAGTQGTKSRDPGSIKAFVSGASCAQVCSRVRNRNRTSVDRTQSARLN